LIFCIVLGVLQIPFPRARTSWILFECIWSAVLSLFQIGSAIGVAVNYAMLVQETEINDRTIYVSMALLVHATWFNSFTCLAYFCLLIISVLTHRRAYDNIWSQSPYEINWFYQDGDKVSIVHPSAESKSHQAVDSWSQFMNDVERTPVKRKRAPSPVIDKPSWAENQKVRRGVDNPFARSPAASPPSTTTPLRVQPKATSQAQDPTSDHSRFLERFCESRTFSRPQSPPQINHPARFTHTVRDHDLPIPLPRLSEWKKAEAIENDRPGLFD
jgi:uncharacterized membrane protein